MFISASVNNLIEKMSKLGDRISKAEIISTNLQHSVSFFRDQYDYVVAAFKQVKHVEKRSIVLTLKTLYLNKTWSN